MKKRKIIAVCVGMVLALTVLTVWLKWDAIFQCGNPLPYLRAAVQISEGIPFVAINEADGIYISRRGQCPELLDYIEEIRDAEFVEQAGSGYIFTDGDRKYILNSEIYWGHYTVWTMSKP